MRLLISFVLQMALALAASLWLTAVLFIKLRDHVGLTEQMLDDWGQPVSMVIYTALAAPILYVYYRQLMEDSDGA